MIEFVLNNKKISTNKPSGSLLLDFVRYDKNMKGTKIGCREGDCGACSVLVYDKNDKFPKPINSCLVRLGQLYKKNVITVEGLGSSKKLNPVQKSFVKNHASQCGYCTPGFVVAGTSIFYENEKIDINLDLFREMPFNIIFHSERWYSHLTGIPIKMDEKFLQVNTIDSFKNKIIVVRSPRYRNHFINCTILIINELLINRTLLIR